MHNIVSEYFLVYLSYAGDNPPNVKQVNNNMGEIPSILVQALVQQCQILAAISQQAVPRPQHL